MGRALTDHESRITSHESRVTDHGSRVTSHESRITSHEITKEQAKRSADRAAASHAGSFPSYSRIHAQANPRLGRAGARKDASEPTQAGFSPSLSRQRSQQYPKGIKLRGFSLAKGLTAPLQGAILVIVQTIDNAVRVSVHPAVPPQVLREKVLP